MLTCVYSDTDSNKYGDWNPIEDHSLEIYTNTFAKFIIMLIRSVENEMINGRNENAVYQEYAQRCFTPDFLENIKELNENLKQQFHELGEDDNENYTGDYKDQRRDVLHNFFVMLVKSENPIGSHREQSAFNVFMAFSQIDRFGRLREVLLASKAPSQILYCLRAIAFREILFRQDID